MKAVLTKVDGVDYQYTEVQGYAHKGKVKKLIEQGWEIVDRTPVFIGGVTLKQSMYSLRRRVTT